MMFETGLELRMTYKTRLFLRLYEIFYDISQWFINHCDTKELKFYDE